MVSKDLRALQRGYLGQGKNPNKLYVPKRVSATERAGLLFSVPRVRRNLRGATYNCKRVAVSSAIYLAAVLEYLVAELLELGGDATRAAKRKTITPRHLKLAIANDDELLKVIPSHIVTICWAGFYVAAKNSGPPKPLTQKAIANTEKSTSDIVSATTLKSKTPENIRRRRSTTAGDVRDDMSYNSASDAESDAESVKTVLNLDGPYEGP